METRLVFLIVGIVLGYAAERNGPTPPRTVPLRCALAIAAAVLAAFLALDALWSAVSPYLALPPKLLEALPLHSLLVGAIAGYLLAEASNAPPPAGGDGPPGSLVSVAKPTQEPPPSRPSGLGAAFLGLSLPTALLLATGLAVSVVPPSAWGDFTKRLTNFEGAGIKVSLGTAAGESVAQNIRSAAPPPPPVGSADTLDRHGFATPRLDRMKALAYPPKLRPPSDPGATPMGDPTAFLFSDICSDWERDCPAVAPGSGLAVSREIQRERAMLLHLHRGPLATDTRYGRSAPSPPHRAAAREVPEHVRKALPRLGAEQERVLTALAPHVACLHEVVAATKDRRLLEYQTAKVVESLYRFARVWNAMEYATVMGRLDPGKAMAGEPWERASEQLHLRALDLARTLHVFSEWALSTLDAWRAAADPAGPQPRHPLHAPAAAAARGHPATHGRAAEGLSGDRHAARGGQRGHRVASAGNSAAGSPEEPRNGAGGGGPGNRSAGAPSEGTHCNHPPGLVTLNEKGDPRVDLHEHPVYGIVAGGGGTRTLFGDAGFTPYLTLFVAQALSAMNDHTAALQLMLDWQNRLDALAEAASVANPSAPLPAGAAAAGNAGVRPAAAAARTPAPDPSARDAEAARLAWHAPWYRLMVFAETVVLQELSEDAEAPHPPTEPGLRYLLKDLFPAVLAGASQDADLVDWRAGALADPDDTARAGWGALLAAPRCRMESHAWRQSLVLSYATYIKTYLDFRNKNLIRPQDATGDDRRLANILLELDLQCFPDVLETPHDQRVQRAQFVVTAAAIEMNFLLDDNASVERRRDLRASLLRAIERALWDLERSPGPPGAGEAPKLNGYVFGQNQQLQLLNNVKSVKARLDQIKF